MEVVHSLRRDFDFAGDTHVLRLIRFLGRHSFTKPYPKKIGAAQWGATVFRTLENVEGVRMYSRKAIVCVGTYDIMNLANIKKKPLCRKKWAKDVSFNLKRLMKILWKKVDHVIWLKVPPIPRLKGVDRYKFGFRFINRIIQDYGDHYDFIQVIDIQKVFSRTEKELLSFYEKAVGFKGRRHPDLVHLNKVGMYHISLEIKYVASIYCSEKPPENPAS